MPSPVEVAFYLTEEEDAPDGAGVEFLWAEPIGDDRYRLLTLPSFVRGVAVNDIISATTRGPELVFDSVSEHSGNSTLRVCVEGS